MRKQQELGILPTIGIADPLDEIRRLRVEIKFAIDYLEAEGDIREPNLERAIQRLRAALKPNGKKRKVVKPL